MGPSRKKMDALNRKMLKMGILKKDIEEKFIKASGRGGQKINKSASAVFLRHGPTGISVKCGLERSQNLNRFLALRRLVEKIEKRRAGEGQAMSPNQKKIQKQKRRRRKRSKSKYS